MRNRTIPIPDAPEGKFHINLGNGDFDIIDIDDRYLIYGYTWWRHKKGYACAKIDGQQWKLHRWILEPVPAGLQVDHIDRNKANNSRDNLRLVTPSGNNRNQGKKPGSTSIYRGVSWNKERHKWRVMCWLGTGEARRNKTIGEFLDEKEAALAYDKFCRENNLYTANLHFPTSSSPASL